VIPQILRRDLPADRVEGIGNDEPLAGDPLAGLAQPVGGGRAGRGQCAPTTPAKTEKA